jgi:protein phosphatase PTC7
MGSDGLFDNLENCQILDCIKGNTEVKAICNCIGNKAEKFSLDKNWDSPFARSSRENGRNYFGGKQDDITVIVSKVMLN